MDVAQARALVLSRDDLEARGMSQRAVAAAIRDDRLRRIHAGCFVEADVWRGMHPEGRHLLHVVAVHRQMRQGDGAFVRSSAAVLWKLPLYRIATERVHVGGSHVDGRTRPDGGAGHAREDVARHEEALDPRDRTTVDGIPCTTLQRTVYDMLRTSSREAGLAVVDAALRQVAYDERFHAYDDRAAMLWSAALHDRIVRGRGARGIRRAREIAALANGRAQLPGESVSRLYLLDLGFAAPRLQVAVPGPRGQNYYVDFGLDDVDAWGEFDGVGKYAMVADPMKALRSEKERQDWIHGTTGRRFVRWGSAHIADAHTLGRRLTAFGLAPRR